MPNRRSAPKIRGRIAGRHAKAATLILAGALVLRPLGLARIPQRWRPAVAAAGSTALAAITRAPLGLRPPRLGAGLRVGGAAAAIVVAAVGGSSALPRVRASMRSRQVSVPPAAWLGLHIPVGTVWSEELAFRGVLEPLATGAFGARPGRLIQAGAFGLSHVAPARVAGDSVTATVLVTAVAGWCLGWLRTRSGSVAAPMLAHLALNESGAVAALAVQRGASRRRSPGISAIPG